MMSRVCPPAISAGIIPSFDLLGLQVFSGWMMDKRVVFDCKVNKTGYTGQDGAPSVINS